MIENASRQFFLVLLTLIAGLICVSTLSPVLGPDLKGGTQLLYEVPQDVIDELVKKENASPDEIMNQTIGVMRDRIDPNGTLDPLITRSGDNGILIELGLFTDPTELKRVKERVSNLGKLEMRMVCYPSYSKGNVSLAGINAEKTRLENWLKQPANKELVQKDPRNIRRYNEDPAAPPGSLLKKGYIAWYPHRIGPSTEDPAYWDTSYTAIPKLADVTVKAFDDAQWNNRKIPADMMEKEAKDRFLIEFVAINMYETFFTGEDLDPARVGPGTGSNGGPAINYEIVDSRKADYADWSAEHKGEHSAIILNDYIKSAPVFRNKIPGRGIIEGRFTVPEVEELVKVLRTGSLRVEPELLSDMTIGASLGSRAVQKGLWSIVGGAGLVFAFMLAYYKLAGAIACLSLLLNMFLLYAGMLFMQATLTLPGLGGIVLTLGMAVDANVLIYERIREELRKGKEMLQAVRAGFERAMSAILDSNITTFLVGVVLFNVGVGPVRGFAVTLMIGIVTTVFTQFFVSRLLFHYALEKNKLDGWQPRALFENRNVDFVGKIKLCVAASSLVIIGGLGYSTTVKPEEMLGIDFTGGANLHMVCRTATDADTIRAKLGNDPEFVKAYPTFSVNTVGEDGTDFNVRLKLTPQQREQVERDRKAWRERRKQAEQNGEDPPPAFKPPYVAQLERVFADELVEPAFSDRMLTPKPPPDDAQQFAQINVHFAQAVPVAKLREHFKQQLGDSLVTPLDTNATEAKDFRVEWSTLATTKKWQLADVISTAIKGLTVGDGDTQKQIVLSDPFPEAQEIQGRLVKDLRNAAIGALILAWALIVFYLRVRFHEYKYGLAAVVALIHDVLVTFGVVVLCNHLGLVNAEINLAMIACFLTIIGYSVNDTIVVFDRIRENRIDNAREGKNESFRSLINRSLNQTLSRTVLTTVLTLFVVIAQLVVNYGSGSDLEGFAFAMTIGMCCGVYSTMFIAAPILIWMDKGEPVIVPDEPHDPTREGDFDNEAELARIEASQPSPPSGEQQA